MKRRPITQQEKDALSLRMKLNNPMHIPEVKQRAAKTRMKRHGKEFSERMKSLHQQGRIPHHSHTIEQRKQASERLKKTNQELDDYKNKGWSILIVWTHELTNQDAIATKIKDWLNGTKSVTSANS